MFDSMMSELGDCTVGFLGEGLAYLHELGFGCLLAAPGHQNHVNDSNAEIEELGADERRAAETHGDQSPLDLAQSSINRIFVLQMRFECEDGSFGDEAIFV